MSSSKFHPRNLCKPIVISGLVLLAFSTFDSNHATSTETTISPTNISHIGFIVVSSIATWKKRRPFLESWWRPNVTRGYVFLDNEPTMPDYLPWPNSTSPPFKVNEDITKLEVYPRLVNPIEIRIMRSILDMYRVGDRGLRWFVMCDDDTIVLVDNLVEVLGKYDHTEYHYIGAVSECVPCNDIYSFDMAYGGAGYALSYSLVQVLAPKLDACIARYPYLHVSSHMVHSCLTDLGVSFTFEKGFHQVDLLGDISGFLSSHPPQSPLFTLHHFDTFDPIFPSMDRYESIRHFMNPANLDQSRMLQQTICYQRDQTLSFSVSWGYSVHIYESLIPRSILQNPLETFIPRWKRENVPAFMFNTRKVTKNPCEMPHVFFFQSSEQSTTPSSEIITTYVRASSRDLPPCSDHSVDHVSVIRVRSSARVCKTPGVIECCDVNYKSEADVADIKIRACMKSEVMA